MGNWERALRIGTAATLAGLKPGTLLCFPRRPTHSLPAWDQAGRDAARTLGLEALELRQSPTSTQVLLYRTGDCEALKPDGDGVALLQDLGYDLAGTVEGWVDQLRLRSAPGVPHEVGCFLGYPGADVRGFIRHGGQGGVLTGWWRVYDDAPAARRRFGLLQEARREAWHYCRQEA